MEGLIRSMRVMQRGAVAGWLVLCLSCTSSGSQFTCRAMKVSGGYGYVILCREDTLICQPYVPAVSGKQVFVTERDALKVGQLVCRKLDKGRPPTLTREEISEALGDE